MTGRRVERGLDRTSARCAAHRALAGAALAIFVLAAACKRGSDSRPAVAPAEALELVRDFAERGCACETDKECVRAIRVEFDEIKRALLRSPLEGDDRAAFDRELSRFRQCGDAAGLTIWLE